MFKKKFISFAILLYVAALPSFAVADLNDSPWDFNVYTIESIGKNSSYYRSDFQGIAGAGQDAYLTGFSLNLLNSPSDAVYSLYTGRDVGFTNGTVSNGGVEFGRNLFMQSFQVNGDIFGGGNTSAQNGTITGNVSVGGNFQNSGGATVNGNVQQNQPFTPTFDHAKAADTFKNASQFWGDQAPTGNWANQFGQIVVDPLQSGRNVIDLSLNDINGSWGIRANGPSDAFLIFNISDNPPSNSDFFKALTLDLTGGLTMDDVLFNFTDAQSLSLQGGTYANLLAPYADVQFSSGVLQGILVANNLNGGGQVNLGTFTGFPQDYSNYSTAVPEPHQYLLLGSFLGLILLMHRKRSRRTAM